MPAGLDQAGPFSTTRRHCPSHLLGHLPGMCDDTAVPAWMQAVPPGVLDPRVLEQDQYWLTVDAAVLTLAAMSTAHLAAVTDFLRARALHLHLGAMIDALLDLVEAYPTGRLTPEAITHLVLGTSIASVDPAA